MKDDTSNSGEELLGDVDSEDKYEETPEDAGWLSLCKSAFEDSTDWMDTNLRRQMEKNYALFRSQHPPGSKYYTAQYQHRTKGFRPKIRSAIRSNEAAAYSAFFSTSDVAHIEAENKKDPKQVASAKINKILLNYRLKKTIDWMKICLGGFQEAQVNGVCVAALDWKYAETNTKSYKEAMNEDGTPVMEDGEAMYDVTDEVEVIEDEPAIRLVPLENIRVHPASDWMDPINSSPYVIELMPMYVMDILDRMELEDPKTGEPEWRKLSMGEIQSAEGYDFDSTRQAREGKGRQDPKAERSSAINMYSTVWVRKVIMRRGGEDWLFYTLGSTFMLSEPKLLKEVYLHGMRPYVMGICVMEAFRSYPAGLVELGSELQVSANELANQRRDNVNLALNKRYHVSRSKNVDMQALMRNVPGGVVMMDDMDAVETIHTPDVTSSGYQEQDRLNVDFDELMGQFSQSSVQSNRSMNETVGGLQLVSSGANQMTEYLISTFAKTFVQPVLRLLVAMEQAYETDEILLALAGEEAQLYQRFGIDTITDDLLRQKLTVTINVGVDATDPIRRIEKLMYAIDAIGKATQIPGINRGEIIMEIMGSVGYTDATRFFEGLDEENEDPQIAQLKQELQQLQQDMEMDRAKIEAQGQITLQVEQVRAQAASELASQAGQASAEELQAKQQQEMAKLAEQLKSQFELAKNTNDELSSREREKFDHEMEKLEETLENKLEEMNTAHEDRLEEIDAKADADAEKQRSDHTHDRKKVVYMEQRAAKAEGDKASGSESTESDGNAEVMKVLKDLTSRFDKMDTDDSGEKNHEDLEKQIGEMREMFDNLMAYQKAPRKVKYDGNGKPVGIEVKGFDTIPVSSNG